jgi:membrane-anchored glycerophosphoryl diester phosphodiesterase (GDPDase)
VVQEDLCVFVKGDILLIFYINNILIFNLPITRKEADNIRRELSKA